MRLCALLTARFLWPFWLSAVRLLLCGNIPQISAKVQKASRDDQVGSSRGLGQTQPSDEGM